MSHAASQIRLILADDHAVLRSGLKVLIERQEDLVVVGEAPDGAAAAKLAATLAPDVAVVDLGMNGGGLEGIHRIREGSPKTKVLVLTMFDDPPTLKATLNAGAAGFVTKSAADAELITAIRAVHGGRTFIGVPVALTPPEGTPAVAVMDRAALSQREQEVLERVALGFSNKEIAEALGLSVKTVETYRARIFEKVGLRSRVDLVRYAIQLGLIGPGKGRR